MVANDGLDIFRDDDESGGGSLIKGMKLKFTNEAKWEAGEEEIAADHEFIVVEILRVVQKWIDQKPVETRVLAPDEKFPDIDELNEAAPKEEWTEKFGKEVGPWQKGRIVYLIDPETLQFYTFPTGTVGGDQAVRDLRESTGMARRMRGSNIYPRIHLSDTHMNTKFGGRQRPAFDIVRYEALGELTAPPEQKLIGTAGNGAEPKQIEGNAKAEPKQIEAKVEPKKTSKAKSRKNDPDFEAPSAG